MKYVSLLLAIILICCRLKAQTHSISLDKYSYILGCVNLEGEDLIRQKGNGTCFFIKMDSNHIYLVTNYHVLNGYNVEGDSFSLKFNDIFFRLKPKNEPELKDLLIESFRDIVVEKKILNNESPDIVALEVSSLVGNKEFNDISRFIDTSYFGKIPDSIIFYGYPSKSQTKESFISKSPIEVKRYGKYKVVNPVIKKPSDKIFFDNYYKFHTPLQDMYGAPGMSGSPVFGIFIENGKPTIKFIGVVKGEVEGLNGGVTIINASEIMKAIGTNYKPIPLSHIK